MTRSLRVLGLGLTLAVAGLASPAAADAKDPHPNACVDCHVVVKAKNVDERMSTLMTKWQTAVDPKLLEAARGVAADASKVKGKHPKTTASLKSIPAGCLMCHKKDSATAPPFSRLMHVIHLGGGEQSPFFAELKGGCTSCHKVDAKTGLAMVPSAPEK